ncbi:DUF1176 domain-containing protein (plasmid) [Rhizobium sp. Pop5]|uniref:DUF1176 domain-containing protein n=1 Tax=Rhizobium sp. Pop5 TaxID=1223565 RepID=UPI000283868F|nr:DUF1176 domain-containing protein [Rhizobium sp. Pop5]EJZ18758.1 hypothetical protein RCCGEPOP_23887 [Rhizobium sp. Pop5]UVD60578.1 DUF1176 domain-containing protein [Rhizobium sp. Pop5]
MKQLGKRTGAILLAGAVLCGPASAAEPSYDKYKSWLVVCDNGLTCEAKGFEELTIGTPDMRFVRAAGPDAVTEVTLSVPFSTGLDHFQADGEPLHFGSSWKLSRDGDLTTISTKDPAAVKELLSDLRNDTKIEIGDDKAAIPLDGMVAALLHMDDRQGRVGGVTALIKTGAAPASKVPAPPALPVIKRRKIDITLSDAEKQRLLERVKSAGKAAYEREQCETDATGEALDADAYPLDTNHALVLIPCIMGAYQGSSLVFIVPMKGDGVPILFQPQLPLGAGEGPTTLFVEPGFDTNTGSLQMAGRGRGVADCGLSAEWVWDGAEFKLAEASFQSSCGGSQAVDWPILYRSR